MRINVFNPYADQIIERGLIETLRNTQLYFSPFLQLLGARWLSAVQADPMRNSRSINSLSDADCETVVMHDWYVTEISEHPNRLDIARDFKGNIFVMSDVPVTENRLPGNIYNIAKNFHQLDLGANWDGTEPNIQYQYYTDPPGKRTFRAPMGCAESWLPKPQHYRPTIFFDEPHISVIKSLSAGNSVIAAHYMHGLAVARILIDRGFTLQTFCREGWPDVADLQKKYEGFEIIDASGWVPFTSIVQNYASSSLFFSFTGETFGYSTFENLQLGNGLIAYSEHRNAYELRQMQNAVLISIYLSPEVCADMICQFFDRFCNKKLRPIISNDANLMYSTETLIPRLRTAIKSTLS
ncbi:hypothetical protein [Methylobacterium sp. 13MFTsu3.1M2]|uniref:hypothetical protein n=1 Tax=Methylobacterium sp. 13MFTsu3.1M2 TaxID=1502776 RepID=UPI0008F43FFB|nr:hypothetical protein [Methylobacterium sp. 13MFTsu3.1M2]SFE66812.1 hypothetical protein SAMN02799627_04015 [Methylobacterium sp. 13MFTsu3.1M2]